MSKLAVFIAGIVFLIVFLFAFNHWNQRDYLNNDCNISYGWPVTFVQKPAQPAGECLPNYPSKTLTHDKFLFPALIADIAVWLGVAVAVGLLVNRLPLKGHKT